MSYSAKYLIAGQGRVARHMAHYFSLLDIPFQTWARGQAVPVGITHAFLAVSDKAVEEVARLMPATAIKIHFSGSIVTPLAYGAHPLTTFGEQLYDEAVYRGIHFIIDDNAPKDLLPLPNPQFRIDAADKAKYHALCVMAGNFSCILWQKLFDGLGEFSIPLEAAQPYLKQQAENLLHNYKTALTGPLPRGDNATIERNLKALEGDPFQGVYQSFVKAWKEINP